METGETVSMEVRPSSDVVGDVGYALRGVLAELDRTVDKSTIEPITIRTESELQEVTDALIEDKREIAYVESKLDPLANIAYTVHRIVTGKRNEYASYAKARAAIRDAAITERALEQKRKEDAENERLRQVARAEEEARRKAEIEELNRRAKAEKRPELKQRAQEIAAEPIREVAITTKGSAATSRRVRGSGGGSVGLRPEYTVEVTDPDSLILGVARPTIYREVVLFLTNRFPKKRKIEIGDVLELLTMRIAELPQIPLAVLEPSEQKIKESAKATDGRINWPGVAVAKDYKTSARR